MKVELLHQRARMERNNRKRIYKLNMKEILKSVLPHNTTGELNRGSLSQPHLTAVPES